MLFIFISEHVRSILLMNVYLFCPVSRAAGDDVTKCWHTWSVGLCLMTTCTKLPICKHFHEYTIPLK